MAKKEAKDLKFGIHSVNNEKEYKLAQMREYYRPTLYIHKERDADVIEHLKKQPSTSNYIISLIRADMTKEKR